MNTSARYAGALLAVIAIVILIVIAVRIADLYLWGGA